MTQDKTKMIVEYPLTFEIFIMEWYITLIGVNQI